MAKKIAKVAKQIVAVAKEVDAEAALAASSISPAAAAISPPLLPAKKLSFGQATLAAKLERRKEQVQMKKKQQKKQVQLVTSFIKVTAADLCRCRHETKDEGTKDCSIKDETKGKPEDPEDVQKIKEAPEDLLQSDPEEPQDLTDQKIAAPHCQEPEHPEELLDPEEVQDILERYKRNCRSTSDFKTWMRCRRNWRCTSHHWVVPLTQHQLNEQWAKAIGHMPTKRFTDMKRAPEGQRVSLI